VDSPFATLFSAKFIHALARNGNYGVTIFFVISGYLITSTSLRRFGSLPSVSARRFYALRFARIIPCLLLVLLIITTLGLAGIPYFKSDRAPSFLLADFSVLTFWHNVLMAQVGYFNYGLNVLWSLSVEEVFYFTFPLLCLALRKTWLIVAVWIAAILFGPLYRSWHTDDELRFLYGYFACFDAIAMGCCTALLASTCSRRGTPPGDAGMLPSSPRPPAPVGAGLARPAASWLRTLSSRVTRGNSFSPVARNVFQACAALFIAWIYLRSSIGDTPIFGPTLIAAATALFLLAEGASRPAPSAPSRLRWEPLGWFGQHSYELYLFHCVVLAVLRNIIDGDRLSPYQKPLWFLLFLALTTLVAALISRFYSEPLNHGIRRHLTPTVST
jgi:peptidoglycan/LPS O-acetylase OafA/YrhL